MHARLALEEIYGAAPMKLKHKQIFIWVTLPFLFKPKMKHFSVESFYFLNLLKLKLLLND